MVPDLPVVDLDSWISTIKLVEKYILKQIDYMKWNLRKAQRWSKSVWTFDRYRPHSLTFRVIISFIKKTIILKKHHKNSRQSSAKFWPWGALYVSGHYT